MAETGPDIPRRTFLKALGGAAAASLLGRGAQASSKPTSESMLSMESAAEREKITKGIYLGFVLEPTDEASIESMENTIGRNYPLQEIWSHWEYEEGQLNAIDTSLLNLISDRGQTPILTWEPRDPAKDKEGNANFSLDKIATGEFDDFLIENAAKLKEFGKPLFLRFAHEMNIANEWGYPWAGDPDGYVAAWRHVHDVFKDQQVENVTWVWSVNSDNGGVEEAPATSAYYPGDDYVDWMAIDGYNWGTTQSWSSWRSMKDIMWNPYQELTAISGDKPIMISETGTTDQGGDKAAWIRDSLAELPDVFPQIGAVVFFDLNKETDWRVDSTPKTTNAFKEETAGDNYAATAVKVDESGKIVPGK